MFPFECPPPNNTTTFFSPPPIPPLFLPTPRPLIKILVVYNLIKLWGGIPTGGEGGVDYLHQECVCGGGHSHNRLTVVGALNLVRHSHNEARAKHKRQTRTKHKRQTRTKHKLEARTKHKLEARTKHKRQAGTRETQTRGTPNTNARHTPNTNARHTQFLFLRPK